ncbi:hypothetical protein diail_2712 [Diaporthe ilicicola]|nr:hypothetical protein diail_2712 [Diaporthe ilicicola]
MSIKRSHVHRRGYNNAVDADFGSDLDLNKAFGNDGGDKLTLSKRVVTVYETQTPEGWLGGVLTTLQRATITQVVQQTVISTEGGGKETPTPAATTPRQTVDVPAAKSPASTSTSTSRGGDNDESSSSALPSAIMASTVSDSSAGGALALATEPASSTSPLESSTAAGSTAASAASATQSVSSGTGSGSSDGATKAGIAIGVLAGIFVVLGLVYFIVAKRKRQMREQERLADDEKLDGPFGDHARAPPTPAKPPRLSLRPMTQLFLGGPNTAEKRASKSPQQNIAMVASPTMRRAPGASAWERPMTSDSQDAHNPFGNHAETVLEEPAAPRNPAGPMTPISEVSMIPSPTFGAAGLALAPRASAITTDSAVLAPIVTHSPPLSPHPPQQGPLHMNPTGHSASNTAAHEATASEAAAVSAAAGVAGAAAGAAAVSGLQRKQSVRKDNAPAPLDLTLPPKLGPVPPSPAGTEFSLHEVESGQASEPSAGAAAIAAAGGPADSSVHRVQLDFKPTMDDEMELHTGQVVRLLHEYDDGWVLSPEPVCLPAPSSPDRLSKELHEDHQSILRGDLEVLL